MTFDAFIHDNDDVMKLSMNERFSDDFRWEMNGDYDEDFLICSFSCRTKPRNSPLFVLFF